jgi:hypothetical protein
LDHDEVRGHLDKRILDQARGAYLKLETEKETAGGAISDLVSRIDAK